MKRLGIRFFKVVCAGLVRAGGRESSKQEQREECASGDTLVVSDEVNPHGLSDEDLTQPGDISAALLATSALRLDDGAPDPVLEIPTDQIEDATGRLALPRDDQGAYEPRAGRGSALPSMRASSTRPSCSPGTARRYRPDHRVPAKRAGPEGGRAARVGIPPALQAAERSRRGLVRRESDRTSNR